jgi:hypothetical protein
MSTDTDRIRLLNDELRKHLLGGGAVMTPGIAALGHEAVWRLVRPSRLSTISAPPTIPTASMTLARLILREPGSFSRSTTTTRASISTRLILLTRPSPNGSSHSC